MRHSFIEAQKLKPGMVIIPPIRTMRHAVVEGFKSQGDYHPGMSNHSKRYVIVTTDIGLRSFEAEEGVNVMVSEHG